MNDYFPSTQNSVNIFGWHPQITGTVLWVIFMSVAIIFLALSLALEYHWMRFGRKTPRVITAELIYFVASVFLFVLAVIAIEAF